MSCGPVLLFVLSVVFNCIFIATCSFGLRHCHGFCAVLDGLFGVFLCQQEAERHDMRGLIETLPRGNERLCFIT